jgi:DALR anticodon binding domain
MFSYDRMLDTRGNTAVYLQFAHARLSSILRKARAEEGVDLKALKASDTLVTLQHDSERTLAFELMQVSSSSTNTVNCCVCTAFICRSLNLTRLQRTLQAMALRTILVCVYADTVSLCHAQHSSGVGAYNTTSSR